MGVCAYISVYLGVCGVCGEHLCAFVCEGHVCKHFQDIFVAHPGVQALRFGWTD